MLTDKEYIQKVDDFFKVPEHVADKIQNKAEKMGMGYVLYETRPRFDDPTASWTKCPVAKITYHKASNSWLVYWCRANGLWLKYEQCDSFDDVLQVIRQDKDHCFWG